MVPAAEILEQHSHVVPGKLRITEYLFEVPRDHANPKTSRIQLFARSARKVEKPADPSEAVENAKKQLPWFLFLQGGPGFECRSPQTFPWISVILDRGYQVLFLDQRGTGLSTALSASTLGLRGDDPIQVEYLRSFRADSIVKDCEAVRKALTAEYPEDKQKWTVMGQSYGGFCIATYLSFYPEGLREAFVCGGLPPLVNNPDEVYERMYPRIIRRNEAYYQKFPEDVDRVKRIVKFLRRFGNTTVRLPSGGPLSAKKFQQLGFNFGFHGGIDLVHEYVLRAATELNQFGHLTRPFLSSIEQQLGFDERIIFSVLHEPIYCQGQSSNWSADRLRQNYPQFNLDADTDGPVYFTGEMIYRFMFEDYEELAKLSNVANQIAKVSDWPPLYDESQLAKNEVPVYAAVYMEDMYVDYDLSMRTAGKIKGCKTFQSNQMYHDAVRSRMDEVMRALLALRDDSID